MAQQPQAIKLSEAEITALNRLAERTGSIASTSQNAGNPSWRVWVKRAARDEFVVIEREKLEAEIHRQYQRLEALPVPRDVREMDRIQGKIDGLKLAMEMSATAFDFDTFIDLDAESS